MSTIPDGVQKRADWFLYAAVLLAVVGGIGPPLMQTVLPEPLVFVNVPFPVGATVRVGAPIPITVQRCNSEGHDVVAVRTRALQGIDSERRYILPGDSSTIPQGCTTFQSLATTVPQGVEPGAYVLEGVSTVRGRWKTTDAPWRTQPFVVVE